MGNRIKRIMRRNKKGFTLLEILLVIGAIGILASIVIVAINPLRQIQKARDAERASEINQVYKAIEQYNIAEGRYPDDITIETEDIYKEICNTGKLTKEDTLDVNFCAGKIDLRVLIPEYISEVPRDSSIGAIVRENILYKIAEANEESRTGYEVSVSSDNNKVSLKATNPNINGEEIAINLIEKPLAPSIIGDLGLEVEGENIKLTWSTPIENKSPITGYQIISTINSVTQTPITIGIVNEYLIQKSDITDYIDENNKIINYDVEVSAINGIGIADPSNQVSISIGVPGEVSTPIIVVNENNIDLNWGTKPNMNYGNFVGYKIRYSEDNFVSYTEINKNTITSLGDENTISHNFNLSNNGEYKFVVIAENQYGESNWQNNQAIANICDPSSCTDLGGVPLGITSGNLSSYNNKYLVNIGNLSIASGVTFTAKETIQAEDITIGGTLTVVQGNKLNIQGENLTINNGGSINVNGRGYQGGWDGNVQNNGYGPGGGQGPRYGAGGGHGGAGGNSHNGRVGGIVYGSIENPIDMGSGGGGYSGGAGGNGGGIIRLVIEGNASILGNISASGSTGVGGDASGGGGGSINMEIGGAWSGTGSIIANGGNGAGGGWYTYGSGGGGGRVAIRYGSNSHSGNISANGGGSGSWGGQVGGAGTIWQIQQ